MTDIREIPTQAEIEAIRFRARQMQAQALRAGLSTLAHWIAHPTLHPHHA